MKTIYVFGGQNSLLRACKMTAKSNVNSHVTSKSKKNRKPFELFCLGGSQKKKRKPLRKFIPLSGRQIFLGPRKDEVLFWSVLLACMHVCRDLIGSNIFSWGEINFSARPAKGHALFDWELWHFGE